MFKVTYDGHEFDVPNAGISDLVALERHFNISSEVLQSSEKRLEHTAFLLWRGLRKVGAVTKDVPFDDDFLDKVEDLKAEEVEEVDPTEAAPAPETVPEAPAA